VHRVGFVIRKGLSAELDAPDAYTPPPRTPWMEGQIGDVAKIKNPLTYRESISGQTSIL